MKMKKTIFLMLALFMVSAASLNAQVTIGSTAEPKATLDVVAAKTDGTTAEGIIAPRLTLAQLKTADGQYLAPQDGAIVYVTNITGGTTTKTAAITAPGYYYFDGTALEWKALGGSASGGASGVTTSVMVSTLTGNTFLASMFSEQQTVIAHYGPATTNITLPDLTANDKGKIAILYNRSTSGTMQANLTMIQQTDGTAYSTNLSAPIAQNKGRVLMWIGNAWIEMTF
jgi:hypothetical protein